MQEDKQVSNFLLGAVSALNRQVDKGSVKLYTRREMLDLVVVDGSAKGIVCRNLLTGEIEKYSAHAVVLATGGYSNVFFLVYKCDELQCNCYLAGT